MVYEVVFCNDCQKPIKAVPAWLSDVKVRFTCETCRQKHPKALAGYDTALQARVSKDDDAVDDPDLLAVAGDDEPVDEDLVEADQVFDEIVEE
ncbi:MAG TPA: hypothetical protein VGK19_07960 [Capsulimonadaceae bacterium]